MRPGKISSARKLEKAKKQIRLKKLGNADWLSLPRALSRLGFCSRKQALDLIKSGQVQVNNQTVTEHRLRVNLKTDRIEVAGQPAPSSEKIYLLLNKPRGLITTTSDDKGRPTVFECFKQASLPRIFPVGRLDRASEGLLLFTNDSLWADLLTRPESELAKTYHVQVRPVPEAESLQKMVAGLKDLKGEWLKAQKVRVLRSGGKTCWLEVVLTEGKNRQIRRMAEALGLEVLRLVRTEIGNLKLGNLPKGKWRYLTAEEVSELACLAGKGLPARAKKAKIKSQEL